MEHGGVGGVRLVLPVHAAGGDDADGGLVALHDADLHGGSLGAQQQGGVLSEIEGVRPLPSGMAFVGVQTGEVVICQLHFGAFRAGEAHAQEDFRHHVDDLVHGMTMPQLGLDAGDGHVQGLGSQLGLLVGDGLGQGLPDFVGDLADHRTFLGRQLAHLLQHGGQFAFLAQVLDPDAVQGGSGVAVRDGL